MPAESQSYQQKKPFIKKGSMPEDPVGRLVPRAIEVEAAVLGALMVEKDAYTLVCDLLKPESFYEPRHAAVYEAIQTLGLEQKPIDMMTVVNQLRLSDTLDKAGGAAFVVGLTSNVASAAHVEFHARIVARNILPANLSPSPLKWRMPRSTKATMWTIFFRKPRNGFSRFRRAM